MKENLLLGTLLLIAVISKAQQVADTLFKPIVPNPVYLNGRGPTVFIDEAHHNFHALSGRFKPFANLLQKDGYIVKSLAQTFGKEVLSKGKIVVISNALNADNLGNWRLPTPSAFKDQEIAALNEWVKQGGSLFLIADHMPFPGAAEKLAASFGIKFYNGFAISKRHHDKDIFTLSNGLQECSLTNGRNESEKVTSIQSFTGQAFQIPEIAHPIVVLDSSYEILMPETAWEFTKATPTISAASFVQGAYLKYGQGRVVVFGEAAMFTAQQQGDRKVGMNAPGAEQNVQFLLNVIHWLDSLVD
jgi:hypothetical protein